MEHLINKDALVAELKERIRDYWSDSDNTMGIYPYALEEVIKYTDTLEVKEVDLEKETKKWWKERLHLKPENQLWMDAHQSIVFAKHFFELALSLKNS